VRTVRNRLPTWAGRTAMAVGALSAPFAAFLIGNSRRSRSAAGARGHHAAEPAGSLNRGRHRRRPREYRLGRRVRMEGRRHAYTLTPDTRFNIGTAVQVVTPAAVASLGLTNTGTDSAAEWSPDHIGEPEEDFPGFTAVHDLILRPIGIGAPRQPLPGDRATFYVPATFWRGFTTDPRSGRRLMYMRDLACCVGKMAFYSTPSDLVRFALATKADSVNGELAGGSVMSLMTRRDNGIVVAVASNIAHANTAALALKVADTFAEQK